MATNFGTATGALSGNRAVQVDRILGRAFATIGHNPLVVLAVSFVFAGLPSLALGLFTRNLRPQFADPVAARGYGVSVMIVGMLGMLFYVIAQGAMVRATIAQGEGRRASFGECALVGVRAILPLIGLNILLGIAVLVGCLLLLVPGIMLYIMWSAANPALVAERTGVFRAFSRSSELTRGARWKVFGVQLIALCFMWLLSSVLGLVVLAGSGLAGMAAMSRDGMPLWYLILSALIQTLVVALWGTIQTSLYVELRDWKDGPAGAALADVFA